MSPNHTPTPAKPSTPRRTRKSKAMAAATLALVMGAGTLAVAAPAQAASTGVAAPCAVTAVRPSATNENSESNKVIVAYPIEVSCWEEGATVYLRQKLMEADDWPNGDDVQRGWRNAGSLASKVGTQTVKTKYRLADMDDIGKSEVYHVVQFRVVDRHGNWSDWITVTSAQRSIHPGY
jgi:hypothetical protein